MWITEMKVIMEVKRQDTFTISLLELTGSKRNKRYYATIHKGPIDDSFKEKLNGFPNTYDYQTMKQARDRFKLLVAIPVQIEDLTLPKVIVKQPAEREKSLREIINESIS